MNLNGAYWGGSDSWPTTEMTNRYVLYNNNINNINGIKQQLLKFYFPLLSAEYPVFTFSSIMSLCMTHVCIIVFVDQYACVIAFILLVR